MNIKKFSFFIREEQERCVIYSRKQLEDLEKFADRLLEKFGLDIEFTSHFGDRMSDTRNEPCISISELQQLFKKIGKDKGKKIKQVKDHEAVLRDAHKDLNLPFVLDYSRDEEELIVTLKTIMRKKDFRSPNQKVVYENSLF